MKFIKLLKWLPITIILLSFSYLGFSEYWRLGVIKDQHVIDGYPFASEGPVAGSWLYQDVNNYIFVSLIQSIASLVIALTFILLRNKQTKLIFSLLYLISIIILFFGWFYNFHLKAL